MENNLYCVNCGGHLQNTTSDGEVRKCDTCCVVQIESKIYYGGQDCECSEHDKEVVSVGIKLETHQIAMR